MYPLAPLLALVIGGYLLGSVLPADWLVRRRTGKHPSELGDNPGAAGAWRLAGPRAAILTTLFDLVKGALPLAAAKMLGLSDALWSNGLALASVACAPVIGHNWPIFHRFRGGRGLSTAVGALLYISWPEMLPALVLGVVAAYWRKWAPLIGVVGFPVGLTLMLTRGVTSPRIVAAVAVMLIVLVRQIPWLLANLTARKG